MRLAFTPAQLFKKPSFDYKRRVSAYADHPLNAPFEAPLSTSVSERSHTVFVDPSFSGTGRDITQVMSPRKSSLSEIQAVKLGSQIVFTTGPFHSAGFLGPTADRIMHERYLFRGSDSMRAFATFVGDALLSKYRFRGRHKP